MVEPTVVPKHVGSWAGLKSPSETTLLAVSSSYLLIFLILEIQHIKGDSSSIQEYKLEG